MCAGSPGQQHRVEHVAAKSNQAARCNCEFGNNCKVNVQHWNKKQQQEDTAIHGAAEMTQLLSLALWHFSAAMKLREGVRSWFRP